jgi:RNA polymerase sigma factor (sigma-70 family)
MLITTDQLDAMLDTAAQDKDLWLDNLDVIVRELADEPLERSVPALRGAGGIDYTSEFLLDACKDIDCSPEEAERAARRLEFTRERARVYNNEQMAREQQDATHYLLLMTVRLMWMRSARRARKLTTGGESDDMVQNAVLQFYKAINRFDWRKSSWVNYVSYWIDLGVRDVIYDWRTVRVPQNVQKDIVPLSRAIEGGIDSEDVEALAAATGFTEPRVRRTLLARSQKHLSTDVPVGDGEASFGDGLIDSAPGDHYDVRMEQNGLKDVVAKALDLLNPRHRRIVARYYGVGGYASANVKQIAADESVSHQFIYQVVKKSLGKMSTFGVARHAYPFLADTVDAI